MGNIDDSILKEEIRLLLPYADSLLAPILKNKLTANKRRSRLKARSSAKKERSIFMSKIRAREDISLHKKTVLADGRGGNPRSSFKKGRKI